MGTVIDAALSLVAPVIALHASSDLQKHSKRFIHGFRIRKRIRSVELQSNGIGC